MCLTIPGRIVSVDAADPESPFAQVDFGVAIRRVSLLYAPEATVGSYVIVQAGFATQVLPESEAREALEYARQLSDAAALEGPGPTTSGDDKTRSGAVAAEDQP